MTKKRANAVEQRLRLIEFEGANDGDVAWMVKALRAHQKVLRKLRQLSSPPTPHGYRDLGPVSKDVYGAMARLLAVPKPKAKA